jgi:hypothetical protein
LKAIHECGLISQTYALIVCHQLASPAISGPSAHPSAMNPKFVSSNGATMNSRTLKPSANMIDPTALAD